MSGHLGHAVNGTLSVNYMISPTSDIPAESVKSSAASPIASVVSGSFLLRLLSPLGILIGSGAAGVEAQSRRTLLPGPGRDDAISSMITQGIGVIGPIAILALVYL